MQVQGYRDFKQASEMHEMLEDSLTYSPLKDLSNKENSPSLFFSNIEKARQSPSTARLFALLGGGPPKPEILPSPPEHRLQPRRLQDFLETPEKQIHFEKGSPLDIPISSSVSDLASEVKALQSSLESIQKDCEFHRQRAVAAQDQVDHLNKYIGLLEEENRKVGQRRSEVSSIANPSDDAEKLQLRMSVDSMEALNRSLARQNDLLRRRSSVTARFSYRDAKVQTESEEKVSVGTDPLVGDLKEFDFLPFLPTPTKNGMTPIISQATPTTSTNFRVSRIYIRDSESQTEKGIWASIEDMSCSSDRIPCFTEIASRLELPSLPIPKRATKYPANYRKSLPSSYPMSPSSNPVAGGASIRSVVPRPLLAPPKRNHETSSVFHSRKEWKPISSSARGKSTGAVPRPRPRWIP